VNADRAPQLKAGVGSPLIWLKRMYLFTIRSRINPKSGPTKKFRDIGGAYVNCYISFKDFAAAEHLANWLIRQEGWIPEERTDARRVDKRHFKTKKEKQYYSDVLKYGWSLVFAVWPADAPDDKVGSEAKRKQKK
jgi:hypothetical protein